jgi:hypothetical protein
LIEDEVRDGGRLLAPVEAKPEPAHRMLRKVESQFFPQFSCPFDAPIQRACIAPFVVILARKEKEKQQLSGRSESLIGVVESMKSGKMALGSQPRDQPGVEDARLAQAAAAIDHKERMTAEP